MAKPKPQALPGMEQVTHHVLDEIAARLDLAQSEWQRWQKEQMAERELLKIKMQEFGIKIYKLKNGKLAVLDAGEPKAYLRKGKDFEDDEAENAEPTTEKQVAILRKNQPRKPEPTAEESAVNVEAFFDNDEARAEVEKALQEALATELAAELDELKDDATKLIDWKRQPNAGGLMYDQIFQYCNENSIKSPASKARAWFMSGAKDGLIKAYFAEPKEQRATRRTAPRSANNKVNKPTAKRKGASA